MAIIVVQVGEPRDRGGVAGMTAVREGREGDRKKKEAKSSLNSESKSKVSWNININISAIII